MAESPSILKRLSRFNPLRIVRAVDTVPRLHEVGQKVREDQKELARQLRAISRQLEQLEHTVKAQGEMLARLPDVHAEVQQCIALYRQDAVDADRMPRVRAMLDPDRTRRHAIAAVTRTPLDMDPGAHIVIEDLLPEEVCDELVAAVPASQFFPSQNMKRQEIGVPFFLAPEYSRVVWNFFYDVLEHAILPAVIEKFRPALDDFMRKHWPALGSFAQSGVKLGVANSRIMLRRPGYRIKPHRDPRWAFLTCLVYLQRRDDPYAYGTQFYRLHQEREAEHHSPLWVEDHQCELVKDVPARRNSAVVFLNSTGAHGAFVPSDAPAGTERFIYQVQFGPDDSTKQMLIDELEGAARTAWTTARGGY
jgi:hypothetical protein